MDSYEDTLSLSALLGDVSEENSEVPPLSSMDFELPITTPSVPDQTILPPNASYPRSYSSDCKTVIATSNTSKLGAAFESFSNGRYHGSSSISNSVSKITTSMANSLSLPSNSNCMVSNSVSTTCSVLRPNFAVPQITTATRSLQSSSFVNNSNVGNISSDVLCYNVNNSIDSNVALSNGSKHSSAPNSPINCTITDGIALSNGSSHATQNVSINGQHHEHTTLPAKSGLKSPVSSDTSDQSCQGCFILNKKLNNSKQWNKFLHQKLINFDKLLHVVHELEREQQRHLDLQLAYDNRTREWRYQQEQLVQLLQEANPLRERLAEVEGQFSAVNKQLKDCLMAKHALELSSHQMRAKIDVLNQQVNPMHQEMTEKKLIKKMADNKRLRMELETKNCEIHNLSEHISSHRLFFERQGKKSLWALRLAARLAEASTAGCLDEETNGRLHSALNDTESTLESQFRGFRRVAEGRLQGNIIELNSLPTMDEWLNDFDKEGPSAWDEQLDVKTEAASRRRSVKQEDGSAAENGSTVALSNRRRGKGASTNNMEEQTSKERSEDDVEENREGRERKRRGPYKKKSCEEKLAIKREGALIEKMFMKGAVESNDEASSDDNSNDKKQSSNRKYTRFVSEKIALGSSSELSNRTKIRTQSADDVQRKSTYDDDSDSTSDFIDCGLPAVKDKSYTSPVKKSFMPSSQRFSPRLSTRRRSTIDSRPAPTVAAQTPVAKAATEVRENRAPAPPSEAFLFGTDSDSDEESNSIPAKNALTNKNAAGGKLPIPTSMNSEPKSSDSFLTRNATLAGQCDNKDPLHRAGDTIHGRAKVSRVFDRGVVSSCSQRNTRRKDAVTLVKLGGTSKVPPKVLNVKELSQLMRESLKEKQRLLSLPKVKFTDDASISKLPIENATATPITKSIKPQKQVDENETSKHMHTSSDSSDSTNDECSVETSQTKNQSLTKNIPDALNKERAASNIQAQASNSAVSCMKLHASENKPLDVEIAPICVPPKQLRENELEEPELAILKDDLAMSSSNSDDDDLGSAAESDAAVPSKARVTRMTRRRNKARAGNVKLLLSDVDLSDVSPERPAMCSSGSNNMRVLGDVCMPDASPERPASSTPIRGKTDSTPTPSREMANFGSIFDSNDEDSCNVSGRPSAANPCEKGITGNPPSSPRKRISENEHVDNSFSLDLSLTTDDDASFSRGCNKPSTTTRFESLKNQTHSRTNDANAEALSQESKSNVCETPTVEESISDVLKHDGLSKPVDNIDAISKIRSDFSNTDSRTNDADVEAVSRESKANVDETPMGEESLSAVLKHDGLSKPVDNINTISKMLTDCSNTDQSFETTKDDGYSNTVSATERCHLVVSTFSKEVCSKKTATETVVTNFSRDDESSLRKTRIRSRSTSKTRDTSSTAGDGDPTQPVDRGRERRAAGNSGGQQTPLKEPPTKRTLRKSARKELNKSNNKRIEPSKANASAAKENISYTSISSNSFDENDRGKEDDNDGKIFKQIFAKLIKSTALLEVDYSDSLSTLVLSPFLNLTPKKHCSKDSGDMLLNDSLDLSLSTDKDESLPSSSVEVSERRSRPVTRRSNSYQLNSSHDTMMPISPASKKGCRSASVTSSRPSTRSTRAITGPTTDIGELNRNIHDTNVSEQCKSFQNAGIVCNNLDRMSESNKEPYDPDKIRFTADNLETEKEAIPKSLLVSFPAPQPEDSIATVDRTPSNVGYIAKPNIVKKTLSAKNGCSIIPRQASATAGLDPTCRVMRRRRNIGMKYTKPGSTELDNTSLPSQALSAQKAREAYGNNKEAIPSIKSPLQSNAEKIFKPFFGSTPSAPEADKVGRKFEFPPTVVKHEARQKMDNAKLAANLTQTAPNVIIHLKNKPVVCVDSALHALTGSLSRKKRLKEKLELVDSASPPSQLLVRSNEKTTVTSLEASDQKVPSSLTKVAGRPKPNIEKTPITSLDAPDQKAPSSYTKVADRPKANIEKTPITSLDAPDQKAPSYLTKVSVRPKPNIDEAPGSATSLKAPYQNASSSLTKAVVTAKPNDEKTPVSIPSLEALDQKVPNSLTIVVATPKPNVEISDQNAPSSLIGQVNEKRVSHESNMETNETTSLEEGEQHSESVNEVEVQYPKTADATSCDLVSDTEHCIGTTSPMNDVTADVSIVHEHDSDGSECELNIDIADDSLDLTGSDHGSASPETSNALEEKGITNANVMPLQEAKETSTVTPITRDEELFGHLSSSSDGEDDPAITLKISAEETTTKTELKEKVWKTPTEGTEVKPDLAKSNASKMKVTKLKGTILDDITTYSKTNLTVTPKAACRFSITKSFLSENQIRELERRKAKPNMVQPTKSAATVTPVASRLLPLKPNLSLQQRKLKNLLAQRRMSQSSNCKQAVARRSLPGLTKTRNLQCSSSQSSLTSSPAVSETESSDEPIRRRTPSKRPRIICSDSDSDSQEPEKVFRLKSTTEKQDTSKISSKLLNSESAKKTICKPAPKSASDVQSLIERISEKFAPKNKTAILLATKTKPKLPSSSTIKKSVLDTPSVEYSVTAEVKAEALRAAATLSQYSRDTGASNTISPLTVGDGKLNTRNDILPVVKEVSVHLDSTLELSCSNSQKVMSCQAKCSVNDDESSEDEMLQINISACDQAESDGVDDELEMNTSEISNHSSTYAKGFKRKADSDSVPTKSNKRAKLSAPAVGESPPSPPPSSLHSDILTSSVEQLKPISFFGTDILFKEEPATREQNKTAIEPHSKQPDVFSETSSSSMAPNHAESLTFSSINLPEISPAHERFLQEAKTQYTSIIDGLMAIAMGGGDWKKGVDKLMQVLHKRIDSDRTLPLMSHLKPLSSALIHHIIRTDPLQGLPSSANMLCPDLYKLFMLMKVVEENLSVVADHPLEELVTSTCHSIVASSGFPECSVSLSPGCLASLAAWHMASCCAVRKYGREPQWQRARCFLVTLLCRHPGSAHAALLTSLFLGRFVFLRMVHYRPSSGLEHAIVWVAQHGAWIGRDAVRKSLLDNMSGRYAIGKSSEEPLLIVLSVLNDLLHKVDKKTKVPYDTPQNTKTTVLGIDVLACWMGKSWVLRELLPFAIRFISTKKNVPSTRLVLLIKEIAESVLVRVGASQTDLAELLGSLLNSEEPIAPVKYKDPKMRPNKQLMSTLSDAVADAVRCLLTAEGDSGSNVCVG